MTYQLQFELAAIQDLKRHKRNGDKFALAKIEKLLEELRHHPHTGNGQVEQLKGDMLGYWSRRIDKKNRLVYSIQKETVTVTIVSASGHYGDK